jgi:hypothetical protein
MPYISSPGRPTTLAKRFLLGDGDEQQVAFPRSPSEPVRGLGGHAVEQRRRVVVGGHAAVGKNERFGRIGRLPLENFGRKEDRCRGAGANHLPERNTKIAIRARGIVVFRVGIAAD